MNTITLASGHLFQRGDYVRASIAQTFAAGTLEPPPARVTHIDGAVLTVRVARTPRVLEWCFARAEDWILWPLGDFKQWIKVKV